jgi:cytochrome c553
MGANTGSFILLRTSVADRSELHNFCLQCHSEAGAQAAVQNNSGVWLTTPPKVHLTTVWDGGNFSTLGGGGVFNGTYAAGVYTPEGTDLGGPTPATTGLGKQHSIGATTIFPPGNSVTGTSAATGSLTTFSCTSCHDPHGTSTTTNAINKYRNLKAGAAMQTLGALNYWSDMAAFGDLATSYVGGVGGSATGGTGIAAALNVWPVWRSATSQNSYKTMPVGAPVITLGGSAIVPPPNAGANNVGMSAFCAQCHGAWHEARQVGGVNLNVSGDDWKRHPVNNALVVAGSELSGAGVTIIDFAHYNNEGDTSRAPYTTTDATKLPAANVTDVAAARYYADSSNDKVFCLTCHFSHGSIYNDLLRWNYTSAVSAGAQTGNTIASNVGCQQCHNR